MLLKATQEVVQQKAAHDGQLQLKQECLDGRRWKTSSLGDFPYSTAVTVSECNVKGARVVYMDVRDHSCFLGFSHRFTQGEPAVVPVVPCSDRCSSLAGEQFPWQLLSLMNKVCFLMNGQNPELRRSWLGARCAVTLQTGPKGGQDHPE